MKKITLTPGVPPTKLHGNFQGPKWTHDEVIKLMLLHKEGKTNREIAEKMPCRTTGSIQRKLENIGLDCNKAESRQIYPSAPPQGKIKREHNFSIYGSSMAEMVS